MTKRATGSAGPVQRRTGGMHTIGALGAGDSAGRVGQYHHRLASRLRQTLPVTPTRTPTGAQAVHAVPDQPAPPDTSGRQHEVSGPTRRRY